MEETTESRETAKNSISILNEFCIRFKLGIPLYHLVAENGAAFAKTFEMQVSLSSLALKSIFCYLKIVLQLTNISLQVQAVAVQK